MNDQETTQGKLAQKALIATAITRKYPFIGLGMLEGVFGPDAQEAANKAWAKIQSKKVLWTQLFDFLEQCDADEAEERSWETRRENMSEEDFERLKEGVISLWTKKQVEEKEYWEQWEKDRATDPT
jgi:hypothetical protein